MNEVKKTKVLYVITRGNWGGAQRYVYDLAVHLPREEFEPVVACGTSGILTERLRDADIKIVCLPSLQRDISFGKELKALSELLRLFSAEKPDIIHLNSSKAAFLGALASRLFRLSLLSKVKGQRSKVPHVIFTVHGWPFLEKRNPIARALIFVLSWITALLSHAVILVSEHDRSLAHRMPFIGRKAVRICNGIAPLIFGTGERIRRAFPEGVRITGTVGELNKNKNQQALIEAARKNTAMHIAIVGEGEMRLHLEFLIRHYGLENRVKLFGFVPSNEALRGFDVFALPSLKEGLPYALLEAKLAGLPIVANRVGGVGEILDAPDFREFTLATMLKKTVGVYTNTRHLD